jgi:hypothetical protein
LIYGVVDEPDALEMFRAFCIALLRPAGKRAADFDLGAGAGAVRAEQSYALGRQAEYRRIES